MFKFIYYFLYIVLFPIYRFHFVGRENLPEGAAVLCANHTANIDAVFIVLANGPQRNFGIIGKEELFRFKPLAAGFSILKEGKRLMIFPEGTRVKKGMAPVRPKAGAPMFAVRNHAPLVPIYIPAGRKAFQKNTVVIGKPYHPVFEGKPTHEQYQEMADQLMENILALAPKELKK